MNKVENIKERQVTYYKSVYDESPEIISVDDLLLKLKDDKQKKIILNLRELAGNEYEEAKKKLPLVCPSVIIKGKRSANNAKSYSQLIVLDFDNLQNIDGVKEAFSKDPYTICCFESPGAKGLKVMAMVDGELESHEQSVKLLSEYFLDKYGATADPACKDVARACFLSWDPDLHFNEQAEIFEVDTSSLSVEAVSEVVAKIEAKKSGSTQIDQI